MAPPSHLPGAWNASSGTSPAGSSIRFFLGRRAASPLPGPALLAGVGLPDPTSLHLAPGATSLYCPTPVLLANSSCPETPPRDPAAMPVPLASLRPLASPGRSWPALLSALAQPSLGSHHRAGSETLRCSPHPHVHTTVDPGEQGPRLGAGRQGGKSRAAWEGAGAAPGGPRAGRGWRAPLTVMLGGGGPKWACLG